ncbi:CAP-Gly domain-containing linker protein 1 [Eucalyptus grandis]|uniref:CAP-Gly domain-containing linker protein 1 n=1 Tax=Eucalyptus grandis TaxID=71139 RepID=UPI00192EF649|nr:CAP-Gly domain-containing linker protein 1 [Eucalyptus grandis]
MEGISGELKQAELKKESLSKAYEQLQSQLSSFLSFTLPWKDLEEHLDGIRRSLERRSEELREGERSLGERARDVASREEGLRSAWQRVEECEEEVRRKRMDLWLVEERLEKCRVERRREESKLVVTRDALSECASLIRDKKEELCSLMQSTEECRRDYDSKKEEVEVLQQKLDSKEKKVKVLQRLLEGNTREVDMKVEELVSVKRSLDECSRTVKSTREELTAVESMLDHSLKAYDESEKRLSVLERTIEKRDKEVMVKVGKLQSVEDKINGCQVEHRKKEEELQEIHKSIEECSKELEYKENQLHSINMLMEEHKEELKSKKRGLRKSIAIGKLSKELKSKEGELENMMKQAKLKEVAKYLELKSSEYYAVQASIKDSNLELASKKRQLESIQIDITERVEQLQLKDEEYAFLQSSTLECAKALEFKKKQCDLMQNSITEYSHELESQKRQLDSIQERSRECFANVELKEKHLHILHVSIGEHSQTLEMKKKECNVQCMKLELERQRLDSIEKSLEEHSREMELRERTSVHSGVVAQNCKRPLINKPVLASCQNSRPTIDFDGKNLQMFLYQHFQEHDRFCHKVLEIIQTSDDAAKLVLDAMEGFYPPDSRNKDGLLDIGVIRRSCIFLLENLILSSAEINPQEREAAMKLAVEWKGKLKLSPSTEHPLEVLGFLRLLVAYKLASAFDANGIQDLVNSVSQFQIAKELYQVVGSSAVPPGSLGSIQQWQIKTEEPENFAVHNADDYSVEYPPPPTILARNDLQLFQTELLNENFMMCKEISRTLENSPDPAKLVLETDVMSSQIVMLEQLVRISPSITHEVKEGAVKLAREWKAKLSDTPEISLEVLVFKIFLAAYNLLSLFNDAPLLGQTLGPVNEISGPVGMAACPSRAHQQLPGEKKRLASDPAIDSQSQPCARKCKNKMNNQGGPLQISYDFQEKSGADDAQDIQKTGLVFPRRMYI